MRSDFSDSATKLNWWDHIKAVIQLPFVILVVIPFILLRFRTSLEVLDFPSMPHLFRVLIGLVLLFLGLLVFIHTIRLFVLIGRGTLAPWKPTEKLVVHGLYRYMRNPMLVGVNLILISEALLFSSINLILFMCFFVIFNTIYFKYSEEPQLKARFGDPYITYCNQVNRWIPKLKPYESSRIG